LNFLKRYLNFFLFHHSSFIIKDLSPLAAGGKKGNFMAGEISYSYNKRGSYEGFIRGELYIVDESILHLREFVDVETTPDRLLYSLSICECFKSFDLPLW
jgi:hypothetical protein